MSRMRLASGLWATAAVGLAACGGSFTSSGDLPTDAEVADLAAALAEGGFAGYGGFGAASQSQAPGMQNAPAATITIAVADTSDCDGGGTVIMKGSITASGNDAGTSATLSFNYTVAPTGCQVTTSGGKTFTITGDPNLKADGDFTFTSSGSSTSLQGSINYDGKFTWTSSDGRAGSCGVDLTSNYTFNAGTSGSSGSATLTGTVCGVSVSRSVNVSA